MDYLTASQSRSRPWLIEKFIDPQAKFMFVPSDSLMLVAEREGSIPFDVPGVELGHHDLTRSTRIVRT